MLTVLWVVGLLLLLGAANVIYRSNSRTASNQLVRHAVVELVIGSLLMVPGTIHFITRPDAPDAPDTTYATAASSSELEIAGAWGVCEEFVKDRLTAPSTAKFPWSYTDRVTDLGEGHYRVKSYVDAQNSFGATVRTNYICEVTKTGKEDWKLESLTTS